VAAEWVDAPHIRELGAADDPQVGPVLLCLQDRCLPLAGQILEGLRVEEGLVELPALDVAHLWQLWVGTTFWTRRLNAAFAIGRGLDRAGILGRLSVTLDGKLAIVFIEKSASAGLSSTSADRKRLSGWRRTKRSMPTIRLATIRPVAVSVIDFTIMSRARAANGGQARRPEHTKVLQICDIAEATLARTCPGLCCGVDAS
jgi:hypothetical protein